MTSRGGHFPQERHAGRDEEHHPWVKASNLPKSAETSSLLEIQGGELKHSNGKKLRNVIQDTTITKIQAIFVEPYLQL